MVAALSVVMNSTWAIVAAIGIILVIIIAWKFLKLAFKIAMLVVAAVLIYMLLRWAGVL